MKTKLVVLLTLLWTVSQAQTGHVMQGAGAVNFSMGGAATAQPIDASGALQWNPAAITAFDYTRFELSAAFFTAAPEVSSNVTMPDGQGGFLTVTGVTEDDRGLSVLPTLAAVFGKEDSPFTWGVSAFGISGFGVDYAEETNTPFDPANFDPTSSNPLLYPQELGGFGHLYSDYMLLQVALTGAYEITENLSIGLAPTFNYSSLEVQPLPLAAPSAERGYPLGQKASALGVGFQAGIFATTEAGFKLGASYKSNQWFQDLEIDGDYLDGSAAPQTLFKLNYPSIISAGLGYSNDLIDLALDYRFINYSKTDGFEQSGWQFADNGFPTGAVNGFGWDDVHVVAAGLQFKGIEKLPLRLGYTFNTNPLNEDNVFFSAPAPAIIENAAQFGLSFLPVENLGISLTYHHGFAGEVSGPMLSPFLITESDPLGQVPQSNITSKMTTDVVFLGLWYEFN
ncbi:MAG: outer membrane protein transport protein [Saprospiraceae bacterium]|nr:outer membrane protein transport protein [Saprospiraceae bacterium]MCB0622457.1 outer membrane protein transport protein [Saprospiraceae bacterium]MCB0676855.1 outer membrane protein transport protein [Saprospiraceae bacterium]MCB0680907.1 outer membrane protein transport protein [Saprospiraceae bacterium]